MTRSTLRLDYDGGVPLSTFVMSGPDLVRPTPSVTIIRACDPACDATKQAPLMTGDYITCQGTLASRPDPANPGKHLTFAGAV